MSALLLIAIPALPVLLACALLTPGRDRIPVLAAFCPLTAWLLPLVDGDVVALPWLLLGTRLGIDDAALPLVLLGATCWTLAGWHGWKTLSQPEQPRFFFFWLLTWCGNLCVFITQDAASFYAAYALMTLAAYGLIVHNGAAADFRAGRVYMVMAVLAEGALLGALLLLGSEAGNVGLEIASAQVAGNTQGTFITMLMFLGFGTKMGLFGLHMWLPLAHPRAPVPASAILSGVMLKAGLMGWLRFLPAGETGYAWFGEPLFAAGCATAVIAAAIGVTQRDPKVLLAYSSASQMGFLTMILALMFLDPSRATEYLSLALLFALHHGLAKSTLFLGIDLIRFAPALGRRLFWIPAAALAGIPPMAGILVKAELKDVLPGSFPGLSPGIFAASLATTVLMLRLVVLSRTASKAETGGPVTPWLCSLLATVLLPWAYTAITLPQLLGAVTEPANVMAALSPVGFGLLAGLAFERLLLRWRPPEVPPGDLLELLPERPRKIPVGRRWQVPEVGVVTGLRRLDRRLRRITTAVLFTIALISILAFLG